MLKKLSVLLFLCALYMWAADFWVTKPFTEWSDKEVAKLLSDSPWAAKTFVSAEFGGGRGSGAGAGSGGRGGGRGTAGDVATPDTSSSGGGGGQGVGGLDSGGRGGSLDSGGPDVG